MSAPIFFANSQLLAIAGFLEPLTANVCDGCGLSRITTPVDGWDFCGECKQVVEGRVS